MARDPWERIAGRLRGLAELYDPREWRWFVGFSGGKDSTALALAVGDFLRDYFGVPLRVLHEETTAEIPAVKSFVARALGEFRRMGAEVAVLEPGKHFFAVMLEKGYPFPRWNMRWCCRVFKYGPVVRSDAALEKLDPELREWKVAPVKARCSSLALFLELLSELREARPEVLEGFEPPEVARDVRCRGLYCSRCPVWRSWRLRSDGCALSLLLRAREGLRLRASAPAAIYTSGADLGSGDGALAGRTPGAGEGGGESGGVRRVR